MEFWNWLLRLVKREPEVAKLVSDLERTRANLGQAARDLQAAVAKKQAQADALIAKAKAHQSDADWAQRVADKVADLIS